MPTPLLHLRRNAAAYGALLTGLLLTAGATAYVLRGVGMRREQLFNDSVTDGALALQQRMDTYQAMLLGTRGVFSSSQEVERREFRAYTESLEVPRRYPGILSLSYAQWLNADQRPAYEARIRSEGFPQFRVWPPSGASHSVVVEMVEPLTERNAGALGFDMFSEPVRRKALLRALETGRPSATGKVELVTERDGDEAAQAGFLLYVPVYETHAAHTPEPTTLAQRRALIQGFVYGAFRMKDLVDGLRFPGFQTTIDLSIYDGRGIRPNAHLYGPPLTEPPSHPELPREQLVVNMAGEPWTLVFEARSAFMSGTHSSLPATVALGGVVMSLLLFLVIRAQVNARASAERAGLDHQRLASEAQAAVRVRDEFLSVAAHELRTPLTSLKLQLQLLFRQLRQEARLDAGRLERSMETCERQTTRLSQLIDSLLDVSRLTSGRMELQLEELDLGEVVRELAQRFESEAQAAGVRLSVDASERILGRWDRLRLEQVITNLVSNALKYGHGAPVDVRVRGDTDVARLEVEDRGIGVAPEDARRIFDRFERAVSSRHYGGLGLGLFITRQLVEALGGRIAVESRPGQGSVFTVTLPLSGPGDGASRPPPPPQPPGPPLH
ncbi:CHASE domain-containing protein [Myxococcus sp. K15C18031901]|uniref:CHASE domain-containing protein n=1 Tax=Myxococcus dinghuensis TaxID=2906761 RepID=UPI0020A7D541|nr:CHASE domain-containing protein [Myxococcus dinghuensis]MCP3099639.1 CHASE domain-containing protein [Myxococcus dinghuensis]